MYISQCISKDFRSLDGISVDFFTNVVMRLNQKIDDPALTELYKIGKQSFTRKCFFTFKTLIGFLMTNLQKAAQRELSLLVDNANLDGLVLTEVTKEAFFIARKKLKAEVFKALSSEVIDEFYKSDLVQRWHGYRILSVDGTRIVLPDEKPLKAIFGSVQSSKDNINENEVCMAQGLTVYDSLNKTTLYAELENIKTSESVMLYKALPVLNLDKNDILVFDRYYPSLFLCFYLRKLNAQFCFRMKTGGWNLVKAFIKSGENSRIITLTLRGANKKRGADLGIYATHLKCRLTRVELDSGQTEVLLTSLTDEQAISVADTKELYGLRWATEDGFKTLKTKVCVENFSGKSELAVRQDFYAKTLIMNLVAVAIKPINTALAQEIKGKHVHQVNVIEAIASLKKAVVSFFVTNKIKSAIQKLFTRIAKITEPIRKKRKFKRKHKGRKKYYMTQKPV